MTLKSIERALTAECVGIDSSVIKTMTEEMAHNGINIHSLMLLRHGKVACEAWSAPLTPETPHMVYSISKSFLSTAYGFALGEGKIKRETKLLEVFPELRPKRKDEKLEKLTIHHLLCMTAGKQSGMRGDKNKNWLKSFVESKWIFSPGESWRYVSDNYYVAAAMLSKVLGESITSYLTPRLYEPLGIEVPFWEKSDQGVEAGGWGLMLKTEDIAKFILCYHNNGVYNGEQIIPSWWVSEATSLLNDNSVSEKAPDSQAGYGCGFWRCAGLPNTYRCEGMFCQYAISFGDYDACLVMTAEHSDLQETLDYIWEYIPKAFIKENSKDYGVSVELPDRSSVIVKPRQTTEKSIDKKTYKIKKCLFTNFIGFPVSVLPMPVVFFAAEHGGNINNVSFDFNELGCRFSWEEDGGFENTVSAAMNGQAGDGEIRLGDFILPVRSYAYWENENTLVLRIRPLAAVAERVLKFQFKGKKLKMEPSTIPGTEEKARKIGDKLKCILIGKWFHWWIDFLVPKVGKILNPNHYGKMK